MKFICMLIFKLMGWSYKNQIPDNLRSFVFLGAPHTSNFDFVPAMTVAYFMKRNARFIIKNEWMRFPLNLVMGPTGAIGIDRNKMKSHGTEMMAGLFKEFPELVLMISPEATRKPNDHWKTGFYYTAQKAGVPIVLGYADFEQKVAGMGKVIYPTDFEKDMREITEFYRNVRGKNPNNFKLDSRFA